MTWAREALRPVSSSLLAPAGLLAAALVVAVGGSGADALGSLGQLANGPDVPLGAAGSVSREGEVGADLSELGGTTLASPGRAKSPAPDPGARRLGPATTRSSASGSRRGSPGGGPAPAGAGQNSFGGGQASASPAPGAPGAGRAPSGSAPSSPTPSDPLGETLDQTRQQLDNLLRPVEPITEEMLGGLGR